MSRVGFLGLGLMGQRMARRVLQAGHCLTVWDLEPDRAIALVGEGAKAATDPAAAVEGVEFAISMLADRAALEQVVLGPRGAASTLGPGAILLEMSTVGPDAAAHLGSQLPAGVTLIDAPVLGSLPEAAEGRLVIMVGALPADFDRVVPLLTSMGSPHRVGGPGAGASMKLGVNLSLGGVIAALGEALALATALGVERDIALDILAGSPWGGLLRNRRAMVESGNFPPQLRLGLAVKDLGLIRDAAAEVGVRTPIATAALSWLEAAESTYGPDVDFAAVVAEILRDSAAGAHPESEGWQASTA